MRWAGGPTFRTSGAGWATGWGWPRPSRSWIRCRAWTSRLRRSATRPDLPGRSSSRPSDSLSAAYERALQRRPAAPGSCGRLVAGLVHRPAWGAAARHRRRDMRRHAPARRVRADRASDLAAVHGPGRDSQASGRLRHTGWQPQPAPPGSPGAGCGGQASGAVGGRAQRVSAPDSAEHQAAEGRSRRRAGAARRASGPDPGAGYRADRGGAQDRGPGAAQTRASAAARHRVVHGRAPEGPGHRQALPPEELGAQAARQRRPPVRRRSAASDPDHALGEPAVRERQLAVFWIALVVVFTIVLIGLVQYSRSLRTRSATAAAEVARLRAAIAQKEQETLNEMKANVSILQEMSWTGTTGDPVAFLSRVADLAQGSRLRVLAVGPLEQQDTPQFSKSWHAVTVQGPFHDLVDLATRVENDRGTLENVFMEAQPLPPPVAPTPGRPAPGRPTPEVLARFRVTALQLTVQARKIIDDAARASGVTLAQPGPQAGLSLPVPSTATESRDPFTFGPTAEIPRVVIAETAAPKQAFDLQGIVGYPGGHLAILNNQIVRTGDKISGHTVEHITDTVVLLRQPDGIPRRISLPEIGGARAARQETGPPPPPTPPMPTVRPSSTGEDASGSRSSESRGR